MSSIRISLLSYSVLAPKMLLLGWEQRGTVFAVLVQASGGMLLHSLPCGSAGKEETALYFVSYWVTGTFI